MATDPAKVMEQVDYLAREVEAERKELTAQREEIKKTYKIVGDMIARSEAEQARYEQFRKDAQEMIRQGAAAGVMEAIAPAVSRLGSEMLANGQKAAEPLSRVANMAGEAATRLTESGTFVQKKSFFVVAVIVFGLICTLGAVSWYVRFLHSELVDLRHQVAVATQTRDQLSTWGLELFEQNGERYVFIPKGKSLENNGQKAKDGRIAMQLLGGR
jgi:hypothetical protein